MWLAANSRAWWLRAVKLVTILLHRPYRRALRHGVAALVEHDRTPLTHDYRTVLDVGANRGQFALVAIRRFPRAQIVCFEPLDAARAKLEHVLDGHAQLRVVASAVADSAGSADLLVSRADDSSSLLVGTDRLLATFPDTAVVERVSVPTERLDALVADCAVVRPMLLKIDVQGAELEVLRGATAILHKTDTVLVECSLVELYAGQALADEVIRFLHAHSFRLVAITSPTLDDTRLVLQADLLFERLAG